MSIQIVEKTHDLGDPGSLMGEYIAYNSPPERLSLDDIRSAYDRVMAAQGATDDDREDAAAFLKSASGYYKDRGYESWEAFDVVLAD